MNQEKSLQHAKQIDAWLEIEIRGKPPELQFNMFCRAITALQSRTVITLSSVTWNAILDRALHQGQQQYPLLFKIKIDSGLVVQDTEAIMVFQNKNKMTALEPIRFLLIELFTILENLTGGILTQPLYQELAGVTSSKVIASSVTGKGDE